MTKVYFLSKFQMSTKQKNFYYFSKVFCNLLHYSEYLIPLFFIKEQLNCQVTIHIWRLKLFSIVKNFFQIYVNVVLGLIQNPIVEMLI